MKKPDILNASDHIDSKLLENSTFFLIGEIDEENVGECIKWIAYENMSKKDGKVLSLYVNSPGGDLYQAFALIDMMNTSAYPIRTIGIGTVMSAAFLIVASGTKGSRYLCPNTSIMCHQLSEGSSESKYHDYKAAMRETELSHEKMLNILVGATDKVPSFVKKRLLPPTDVYMTAEEMINFGAADLILE